MIVKFTKRVDNVTVEAPSGTKVVPTTFVDITDRTGRIDSTVEADPEMLRLLRGRDVMYRNCRFDKKDKTQLLIGKEVTCKNF